MSKKHFYIHQGPHCWQIVAINPGAALYIWRSKAGYPDGTPIKGKHDKIHE